jgi:hypothetical protein
MVEKQAEVLGVELERQGSLSFFPLDIDAGKGYVQRMKMQQG